MSISEALGRLNRHEAWRAWKEGDGPEPPPGYRDCPSCKLRDTQAYTAKEKADFCAACPYLEADPKLPLSMAELGSDYIRAQLLASLPTEAVQLMAARLTFRELRNMQTIREYKESQRMAALMGVSLAR